MMALTPEIRKYADQIIDKCAQTKKRWVEIGVLVGSGDGLWTVAGDFNSVRHESERRNSNFHISEANEFNEFVDNLNLHEFSLKGRRFTFVVGDKLSRIDRIFVN